MAAATGLRKSTSSINDYPEHLNPFRDEDNHNRIRFWTITKKPGRSNSFSLNNLKDFRNTWSLKSFMKKNKKGQDSLSDTKSPVNGETSPIVYRRPQEFGARSSPDGALSLQSDRYVYGGSVTPLPRSRFQERMRSTPPPANTENATPFRHMAPGRASYSHRSGEPYALPGLTRSEYSGSRASVESGIPFEDGVSPYPVPTRRKKKRAAPLPPVPVSTPHTSANMTSHSSPIPTTKSEAKKEDIDELSDDPSLKIQLKIEEDVETKPSSDNKVQPPTSNLPTNEIRKEESQVKIREITKIEIIPETITVTETKGNDDKKEETTKKVKIEETTKTEVRPATSPTTTATQEAADTLNNNKEEPTTPPHSPVEIRNKNPDSMDSDDNDVVFKKVNIREYRRNSSFNSDSLNLYNGKTELSPLNNKRCKSLSNTINSNNNSFTAYDITLHIDEDNNEVKDVNDNQPQPQKVVCKLLDTSKPRKKSIDNSISSTEKEFMEIDRATRELEQEIHRLNSSVKYMDDNVRKSNGRTSFSEIKSKFENSIYSPNPIPKPRRSRADSSSPVSPRHN